MKQWPFIAFIINNLIYLFESIIFTFFILKCFVDCFIWLLSVQMLCGYSVFCTVLYVLDCSNKKKKKKNQCLESPLCFCV